MSRSVGVNVQEGTEDKNDALNSNMLSSLLCRKQQFEGSVNRKHS